MYQSPISPTRTPTEEAQRQLDRAKIHLMNTKNSVFITTILFNLNDKFTDQLDPPTAATNGKDLYIHPDYWAKLTPDEHIGLLAHEAWHVALQHNLRCGDRDPQTWNEAADLIIDDMLMKAGYTVPDAMTHPDVTGKNLSTEDAYEVLMKHKNKHNGNSGTNGKSQGPDVLKPGIDQSGQQKPQKDGQGNPIQDPGAAAAAAHDQLQQDVTDMLLQASTASKMANEAAGTIPSCVERDLQELLDPKLPWNTILANFVNAMVKDDYSYRKPNRRFLPDHWMPSMFSEGMGEVAIAVDTSGSVSDDQFAAFRNEMEGIRTLCKPQKTRIVDFDCGIKDVHELDPEDSMAAVPFKGYGGTDLQPVFEYFKEQKNQPEFLIVFSDLFCHSIPKEDKPPFPVFWICIDNPSAHVNFGQLIHVSSDELTP